jgi:hypothetical protein
MNAYFRVQAFVYHVHTAVSTVNLQTDAISKPKSGHVIPTVVEDIVSSVEISDFLDLRSRQS